MIVVMLSTVLAITPLAAQDIHICGGAQATIVGTTDDDILRGTPGPDVISALQGNDIITGLGGDDIICGGQGNDRIFGGQGFDILFGAQGNDTLFSADGSSLEARRDTVNARMFGGDGDDVLHGSDRWDRMQGGLGDDVFFGYEGRDWIRGGGDNDSINGGTNIDNLHGGNGQDVLHLTDGDVARGGAGADFCDISEGEPNLRLSCSEEDFGVAEPEPEPTTPAPEPEPEPEPAAPEPEPAAPAPESEIEVPAEEEPPAIAPPTLELPPADQQSILESGFILDGENGTEWEGRLYGIVPVGLSAFSGREGRCFLILGELTPRVISSGIVSRGFEAPTFGAVAGEEFIGSGSSCDTSTAERLGYDDVFGAEAFPGTTVPVYRQIFVPSSNTASITSLVVRGPLATSSISGPARNLSAVPAPSDLTVSTPPAALEIGVDRVPFDTFEGAEWEVNLLEVLETTVDPRVDRAGRCFLVLGELTATVVNGTVNSGFETPRISGIVDGRHVDDVTSCNTAAARARGFRAITSAEVGLGQTFRFYSAIFVSESRTGALDQIIVGRPTLDGHLFDVPAVAAP